MKPNLLLVPIVFLALVPLTNAGPIPPSLSLNAFRSLTKLLEKRQVFEQLPEALARRADSSKREAEERKAAMSKALQPMPGWKVLPASPDEVAKTTSAAKLNLKIAQNIPQIQGYHEVGEHPEPRPGGSQEQAPQPGPSRLARSEGQQKRREREKPLLDYRAALAAQAAEAAEAAGLEGGQHKVSFGSSSAQHEKSFGSNSAQHKKPSGSKSAPQKGRPLTREEKDKKNLRAQDWYNTLPEDRYIELLDRQKSKMQDSRATMTDEQKANVRARDRERKRQKLAEEHPSN